MENKKEKVGEWHVDGFNVTSVIEKQADGRYKHIAECSYGRCGMDEQKNIDIDYANAKRICRAVNMHDELVRALEDAIQYIPAHDIDPSFSETKNKYTQLLKALQE